MLRKLAIPVLTVSHLDPEKEIHAPAAAPFDRILYATDLAEGSQPGLEFLVRLARGLDAQLVVAHVLEHWNVMFQGIASAAYCPKLLLRYGRGQKSGSRGRLRPSRMERCL
jgi:hypothetical protein